MFSKGSNCLILTFLISLFALGFCLAASTLAMAMEPDDALPMGVIRTDVTAQNNHDWSTFLAIRTTKAGPPENRNDWIKVREINPEADIMKNIVTAQLARIKPLPFSLAKSLMRMDKYLDLYSEVRAYYVAIDYRLKEENRSFYNGVNYRFYVLASEEGHWVIIEASEAAVHRMIEIGYGFGTPEEELALKIQEERELTGKFINPEGEIIESLGAPIQVAGADDHQRPSIIKVYRVQLGQIDTVDFYTYVKNVLPNEWIASWPAQSLLAGAIACKMYGWYRVYFAKYPGQGYDVRDDTWDQVYKPGSEHPNTNKAVDDVNGMGVDRADGKLFETQYCAGTYGPEKPSGDMLGRMSQWGTKYWADQGEDYIFMVHYYWDYSPQAGGQLAHFFNYDVSPPTVETRPATSIVETGAILNGRIVNDGGSSIIERRFDWGITPDCSDGWTEDVSVSGDYFSYYLAGLNPNTTYYFRAWAKNIAGWSHGDVLNFITEEAGTPDLIVEDIWLDPDRPVAGASNTIRYRIKNQGNGDAVGTFRSERYFDGEYKAHVDTDGLAAGSTKTYRGDITWPSDCNSHTIKIVVDVDGDITESNEGNNERSESFSAICYILTINVNPSGSGSINLNPPGGTYDAGTVVTLTANPSSGYRFDHWSGDLSGSENPTTITMNSNKSVTANFTKIKYTLTTSVNPSGSGSVSLNPPGGTYDAGTVVTLTATPNSGYRFDHWSGDLSGSSNPTTITMNSNKNVTAHFVRQYTLTTSVNPSGSGSINLNPPGGTYDAGTVVTLTANPSSGWSFDHWSGDLSGSSNPTTITMNSNKNVTAHFTKIQYTLTTSVNPSGSGSINLNPPGGTYDAGTVVTLTANPNSGWKFDHWSGDLSGSSNPATITMNSNKNVTAHFTKIQYTLTSSVNPSGSGSVSLNPPGGTYDAGTVITLTANPSSGWKFDHWSGDLSGSENPDTITMNSNKNVTANFVETTITYTLTTSVNPSGSGGVNLNPPGGTYDEDTVVTLTANPNSGWEFDRWSGDLSGSENPATITMDSDKNVTAHFTKIRYTLTTSVNPSGSGSINLNPPGGTYDEGTVVTLTANPNSGWSFDHWSGDLSGSSNPATITMDSDKNVTAHFSTSGEPISGTITDGVNPIPATVEAWQNGTLVKEVDTPDGYYVVSGLQPGTYAIRAYSDGYYAAVLPDEITPPAADVNLSLEKAPNVTITNKVCDFWSQDLTSFDWQTKHIPLEVQIGDVVTAQDPNGILCGIAAVGEFGTNEGDYFIHVYGDDATTPDVDEGAQEGDTITFFINGYPASIISGTPQWHSGGSFEVSLSATISKTVEISIRAPWNFFSFNVLPPDKDIETVLSPIDGLYTYVRGMERGGTALTYDPNRPFNDLTQLEPLHGYEIKMSGDAILPVTGMPVSVTTPIELRAPWNFISYLPDVTMPIEDALASIDGLYTYVRGMERGGTALTYDPNRPFNDLEQLEPLHGYEIKMSSDATLVYPSPVSLLAWKRARTFGLYMRASVPQKQSLESKQSLVLNMAPALGSEAISGTVTDGTDPIQNATVQAWQNNQKIQETITAPDGSYTLSGLAAGTYIVRVHKEGFYAQYLDNQPAPSSGVNVVLESLPSVISTNLVCDFWSNDGATYSGDKPLLQIGDVVTAIDPDGVICGVTTVGEFGTDEGDFFLHVYGDDATTPSVDEGAVEGDTITLMLNKYYPIKDVNPQPVWHASDSIQLTLAQFDRTLPVGLSAVKAMWIGDQIILRWNTQSETNNLGWDVYRSDARDGKYRKINAAMIAGAGTSAEPHTYQFVDEHVEAGNTYFYYLENIDFEGRRHKSHIIQVEMVTTLGQIKYSALYPNFPNPFNPDTWIPFQLASDSPVVINIYDIKGKLVRRLDLGHKEAGYYLDKLTAAYWDGRSQTSERVASGIYLYTIKAGKFTATGRMVMVK